MTKLTVKTSHYSTPLNQHDNNYKYNPYNSHNQPHFNDGHCNISKLSSFPDHIVKYSEYPCDYPTILVTILTIKLTIATILATILFILVTIRTILVTIVSKKKLFHSYTKLLFLFARCYNSTIGQFCV